MRKFFLLFFCFSCATAYTQKRYQVGLGAGLYFLQSVDMRSGNIGLKFKNDKNVFADFNMTLAKKNNMSLGAQFNLNFSSEQYELDKSIPYYSAKRHIPIYIFESAELNIYIKKSFPLSTGVNSQVLFFVNLGPCFNFNEGDFVITKHDLRDDNGQSFQLSYIREDAQKLFIPYIRVTGGIELLKKFKKKHYLGIAPFISWAGLQSENNDLTVLKNDPTYISTGKFKRNRSGFGLRLIFQNR